MNNATPPKLADVYFYHLEHQPLDKVLPSLVEKTLARGWRAVIQCSSDERLAAIDQLLWTYSEDSFLAHGTARTGDGADQPVFLTLGDETPNGAGVRFLVDGATTTEFSGIERIVYVFDGNDSDGVDKARQQWKRAKAAQCTVAYWQQTESGGWEKKA